MYEAYESRSFHWNNFNNNSGTNTYRKLFWQQGQGVLWAQNGADVWWRICYKIHVADWVCALPQGRKGKSSKIYQWAAIVLQRHNWVICAIEPRGHNKKSKALIWAI